MGLPARSAGEEHGEKLTACATTQVDLLLALLEFGADPNVGTPTPLLLCCGVTSVGQGTCNDSYAWNRPETSHDRLRMLEALLANGADPFATYNGRTAMDGMVNLLETSEDSNVAAGADPSYDQSFYDDQQGYRAHYHAMCQLLTNATHAAYRRVRSGSQEGTSATQAHERPRNTAKCRATSKAR